MPIPPPKLKPALVVAFLDELRADPSLLEKWVARAEPADVSLVVYAPGQEREQVESALQSLYAQLGLEPAPGIRAAGREEDEEALSEAATARYTRQACGGPLALVPRLAPDQPGLLRFYRINEALVRRGCDFPTGPPDFVGVGVQRAGTTWWSRMLDIHPEIVFDWKERHFFDGLADISPDDCPIDDYHRSFVRPKEVLVGEFTPDYIFQPWTPPLLKAAAPQAKLLVMVRDPIERYRSGLGLTLRLKGQVAEDAHREHLERGLYALQLERLLLHFPREQVLVLQYERCVADPHSEYERTLHFFGAREPGIRPVPWALEIFVNKNRVDVPVDDETRRALAEIYRDDTERLVELVPDLELDRWPSLGLS